jgi:hypothetical protein
MMETLDWLCSERQHGVTKSSRLLTESKNLQTALPLIAGFASCGTSRRPRAGRSIRFQAIEYAGVRSAYMEVMRMEEDDMSSPCTHPIVQHGPTQYFADLRLRQFRNVQKPHEYWDFESERGKQMCKKTGVVMCQECRLAAIIWPALDRKELRCMNCLALIVPRVRL